MGQNPKNVMFCMNGIIHVNLDDGTNNNLRIEEYTDPTYGISLGIVLLSSSFRIQDLLRGEKENYFESHISISISIAPWTPVSASADLIHELISQFHT